MSVQNEVIFACYQENQLHVAKGIYTYTHVYVCLKIYTICNISIMRIYVNHIIRIFLEYNVFHTNTWTILIVKIIKDIVEGDKLYHLLEFIKQLKIIHRQQKYSNNCCIIFFASNKFSIGAK